MKPSKTKFWQYQLMVLSRATRKAWSTFGALGTVLGLAAAVIAGLILGDRETLKSALLTALISMGILLVVIGAFFVREPVTIYNEQQSQIDNSVPILLMIVQSMLHTLQPHHSIVSN